MTIGEMISARREVLGWSRAELARRSGVPRTSIVRFEGAGEIPGTAAALALAEALGVPDAALPAWWRASAGREVAP